jgi:hypothetical protein
MNMKGRWSEEGSEKGRRKGRIPRWGKVTKKCNVTMAEDSRMKLTKHCIKKGEMGI